MHLRPCRGVVPTLTRLHSRDVAALQHAVRSFHISARREDESSDGNNGPAPGNSARARSQAAGATIQSLPRTGGFSSGQTQPPRRIISPYLLQLKAKRRAVKPYTPHQATKDELASQSALSATLGQPGGAPSLLDARLRSLADRAELSAPVHVLAQARRLVRGQFVKFTSDKERDAVMAHVASEQARIARKLSAQKGVEIPPKPLEFAELDDATRKTVTDALVAGAYAVRGRAVEAPSAGRAEAVGANRDIATRVLDLNGSYVGADAGKFLGRLNSLLGAQGAAASSTPEPARQEQGEKEA
ncbi:hypothetical protein UCDDS831_g05555 [Diplodia seriata]|uniref:Uncharacterized protein n=1 Tax=Diplodia seriata TaxID=420778 RepID=A0A0G2GRD0_9PEZI|nr:hypothetical protein UCDDS831_g05555 [Diplodia seriata]